MSGKHIVGVELPFNGSPFLRKTINLMNIYDDIGIEHNWPEAVGWGIEPLRHIRAFLVSWHDPFLRLANGRYFVFGGDVHSRLPVNRYFEWNRYGLHGDVIILKPASNGEIWPGRVEYMNVPEELLYPVTMAGFMAMINNMP